MGLFDSVRSAVDNVTSQASNAVSNVVGGAQQAAGGVGKIASGDLRGVQDIGAALVNTPSSLYGNLTSAQNALIESAFSPLAGTPFYGMTAGNLMGLNNTVQGILRGNLAGIQDLPGDIGAGVQAGLDAGKDLVESLGDALGGLMGGGGGAGGGAQVLESLTNLANQSAGYAANLPDEFQRFEGDRFAAPSDRTTAAENALYNQQGSNIQGAYDLTRDLTGKAGVSDFTSNISGAQNFAPVGLQGERNFGNASNAGYRNYSNMDVQAGPTAGAQEFNATTFQPTGPQVAPDRYTGRTFEGANYNPTAISSSGRDRSGDALNFEGQNYGNVVDAQARDFGTNRTFQQDLNQYTNPYNQNVIDASLEDLNRARILANQSTDADAIRSGAAFGSRHNQIESENFANYLKEAGRLSSQMRQQGFDRASQLAAQDRAQRLGLTAESQQQAQQLGTQGALQGQSLTAGDLQAARDATLRSQLQSQQLGQQGDLQTQQLQAQAGMQGQSLTADAARQAQQLMAQTGMQGQSLSADARQQANQLLQQAALQGQSLTAGDLQNVRGLNQASYDSAAQRALNAQLQAQQLGVQSGMQGQRLGADSYNLMQQLQNQGALQGQNLTANNLQTILNNNLQSQLQAQTLGADSFNEQQDRLLDQQRLREQFRQSALSDALTGANNLGGMGLNLDNTQRQQLLDRLSVGQYQDARNQQQLDFDYEQYKDEQAFPATYLDNLNRGGQLGLGIADATSRGAGAGGGGGKRNVLADMIGGGLAGFMSGGGYGALAGAAMGGLGVGGSQPYEALGSIFGDDPAPTQTTTTNPSTNYQGGPSGSSGSRGGGRTASPIANPMENAVSAPPVQRYPGGGPMIGMPAPSNITQAAGGGLPSSNITKYAGGGGLSSFGGALGGSVGGGMFGGGGNKMSGNFVNQIQNNANKIGTAAQTGGPLVRNAPPQQLSQMGMAKLVKPFGGFMG